MPDLRQPTNSNSHRYTFLHSIGNQMFNLNHKLARHRRRDGISIIEVLTSMAVATIGVFGIMVMIPFAVKQSQIGLDSDAANAVGRNVIEEFQIHGFFEVLDNGNFSRLLVNGLEDTTFMGPRFVQPMASDDFDTTDRAPGFFHFDPLGFAAGFEADTTALKDVFAHSFVLPDPGGVAANDISVFSATTNRIGGIDINNDGVFAAPDLPGQLYGSFSLDPLNILKPLTTSEARLLCLSKDELFFETEQEDDIAPAQPLFDLDGTNQVKRQSNGRISWSAFVSAEKDLTKSGGPVSQLRTHLLVYRDRSFTTGSVTDSPLAQVANANYGVYLTDLAAVAPAESYAPSVNLITFPVGGVVPTDIGRDEWIMLINRIPEPDPAPSMNDAPLSIEEPIVGGRRYRAAHVGYRLQTMFAKVTRVNFAPDGTVASLSVDGGAFDFVPPGIDSNPGSGNPPSSPTYMVHLRNVVNVYERSIPIVR